MENENLKPVQTIPPFTRMIMTIGTLPTSFYSSMSYYEAMVWLYEYLKNEVIPAVNNNGEAVIELQEKYIELKSYIDNYFENLDVQEEINKKLDEMAEDGTITNLIKGYIDPLYGAYETEINGKLDDQDLEISNFKILVNGKLDEQDLEISSFKSSVNTQIGTIDEKVDNATSGSPKGVYATVSALTTADPDHDYIYVVSENDNWYYYDSSLLTWTSGGVYQGTAIPDADMKRLNTAYAEVKNVSIEDISNGDHGYYSSTSPYSFTTNDSGRTSDYIICEGYTKMKYLASISSSAFEITYFNRNKELLPNISLVGQSRIDYNTVDIPNEAYYVRVSAFGMAQYPAVKLYLYVENGVIDSINNLNNSLNNNTLNDNITNELLTNVKDLKVVKFTPTIGGYVRYNDGKFEPAAGSIDKRTDFINVKNFNKIKYSAYISSSGCELAFYNQNKEYLKSISIAGTSSYDIKTIDVPESAYYVVLSKYTGDTRESFIALYNDTINYKTPIINKNILIYGDSITKACNITVNEDYESTAFTWENVQLKNWSKLLNDKFYAKEIRNYALAQATYSLQSDYDNPRLSLINQVQISINDKDNPNNIFNQNSFTPDIVIFAGGTNQHIVGTYQTAMSKTVYEEDEHTIDYEGTLSNLDKTKEIEAARYCFMKIKHEWPMAQIFVVLPIQRMSRDQLTNDINIELPKLAERYGAIIINGCDNGITQDGNVWGGSGATLSDGLHPNQNGQYLMFRQIFKSLEENYFDYSIFE